MTRPEPRRHAVRVWLPDRPGGLGAIASRVGAVGAEIVGIEIVDREGGQAVDDLLVQLPRGVTTDLLVREIGEVDGARVEDVRDLGDAPPDARLQALEAACSVAEAQIDQVLDRLAGHAHLDTGADWTAVVDVGSGGIVAQRGGPPDAGWLAAYVTGSLARPAGSAAGGASLDDDTVCLRVGEDDPATLALAVGRAGRGFRPRERTALELLGRLAAARLSSCDPAHEATH